MAKILLFDIETAPLQGALWSLWKQTLGMNQIFEDWYMLTWAAKWLGEKRVMGDSLHFYDDMDNDRPIVESLHKLIDEADILVAHNGDRFDVKKINTRFLHHGLTPPSPYKTVDTLKVAKNSFSFTSNRLDSLGQILGVGRKQETGGMDLWMRCLNGDRRAFKDMFEYNKQDVRLLEEVYYKLRPWCHNHPNLGVYNEEEEPQCPKCGSTHLHWRGHGYTQTQKYHKFQCQSCGGWGRSRFTAMNRDKSRNLVTNQR